MASAPILRPPFFGDAGERLESAKTDHEAGPHEPLLHQVDEAGAARDELRLVAMPGEQRQRLVEARWFEIGEGDHVTSAPAAAAIDSMIL